MEKLNEIRSELRHGDLKLIAEIVKCTQDFVTMVMKGKRGHEVGKGKEVINVAYEIIEHRRRLIQRCDDITFGG